MRFPQPLADTEARVFLEDTDRELPERIDANTRYAYWKTIARGGKSIIQSCRDLHLARTICHKALRPELEASSVERHRFLREARVTAMLQHPGTVPVHELGRTPDGKLYFTMKLVHGYTLREILNYRERYDLSQLIEVVVQVGRVLDYAHTHGVVHRDLKPENILVGPYGETLVLDWGLAKVWSREGGSREPVQEERPLTFASDAEGQTITGRGGLEGTVVYMSPEQIRRDEDLDHRTDLFSIGTVLYELLAGQRPIAGERGARVDVAIHAVLHDEPPKPSKVTKLEVPKLLEQVCMRCIRKDPAERVQTAAELVRLLQEDWR